FKDQYYERWLRWGITNYRKVLGIVSVIFLVSFCLVSLLLDIG
ncbi:hypothetical protein NO1_2213, partial [Candidatus Termititenax aidoneus]